MGEHVVWRGVRRLDLRKARALGLRGNKHEEGRSRRRNSSAGSITVLRSVSMRIWSSSPKGQCMERRRETHRDVRNDALHGCRKATSYSTPRTCWWNVVLSTPPGFQSPPRKDFGRADGAYSAHHKERS